MKSAQPWTDDQLQQAFDGVGEHTTSEAIKASEEGRLRLDKLAHLRRQLQDHAEHVGALDSNESNALFEKLNATIQEAEATAPEADAGARPPLQLVPATDGEADRPVEVIQEVELWRRMLPAAGLLAAAAAIALVYLTPSSPSGPRGLAAVDSDEPELIMIADHAGTEVVEADFGDNIGTIFEVEGNAGEPVVVVWISDEHLGADGEPKEVLQ